MGLVKQVCPVRGGAADSSSYGGLEVFGPDSGHVFQLAGIGHVVERLVLGQDFHQGAELQPPLFLWDPVSEGGT